jgi:excisionase family DNA binding protein
VVPQGLNVRIGAANAARPRRLSRRGRMGRPNPYPKEERPVSNIMADQAPDVEHRHTESERLLTPGEVAAVFRVDPKTVTRWAAAGRIRSIRTPGGHRRFRESAVRTLLEEAEGGDR